MLNNLTIKMKLIILMLLIAFGFLINIALNELNNDYLQALNSTKTTIEKMQMQIFELRKYEKDFLSRKDLKYQVKFQKTYESLLNDINSIQQFIQQEKLDKKHINEFSKLLSMYKKSFNKMVNLQQKIGLHSEDGLYKKLGVAVKELEINADETNDFYFLADVLTVRKQEKDFMIHRDTKYSEEFLFLIDNLLYDVQSPTKEILEAYKKHFLSLVKEEINIGLTFNKGLKGHMRNNILKTEKITEKMKKELESFIDEKENYLMIKNLLIALSIMSLIIVITYLISTNIFKSINLFQNGLLCFFKYLNREQNSVEELEITGKDEISSMSRIINENIQTIKIDIEQDKQVINESILILAQYEKGDFNGKIYQQSSNPTLNELILVINKMSSNLENNIDSILNVFSQYKNSDYTHQVSTTAINGHLEKLAIGVNDLGENISDLLKQSLQIGFSLDKSSDELIINVNTLNQSANSAATSLEETAGALEEITGTIVSNSNNVEQMNQYTVSLNMSAKKGQSFAKDTNIAMDEITEQVTLINDAISIIDQIAFQTNILSLNAAVEAATAGEEGKGFAVVAQEVRNLASRSAQAAKEIKDLVESATNKTASGKEISSKMIEGYGSLLNNIQNATQKIDEIANASKEQEKGIRQINESINQLDKQSQQNASIASKTNDIAIQTDKIAKEIVNDANKKNFIGKEEVSIEAK